MLPETTKMLPESDAARLDFQETELTLGMPGGSRSGAETAEVSTARSNGKRGFSETVDLSLGSSMIEPRGKDQGAQSKDLRESQVSGAGKPPPQSKAQVVGWPPVKSAYRKNALKSCTYVKVAVDGAPYLRKVDLEMYSSYQQLLHALEEMFTCFTICHSQNESKLIDLGNGTEFVPTYEDREGDWMLVGDVPWKMFVESCKRVRLMKSSEAVGLGPRRLEKCTSSR